MSTYRGRVHICPGIVLGSAWTGAAGYCALADGSSRMPIAPKTVLSIALVGFFDGKTAFWIRSTHNLTFGRKAVLAFTAVGLRATL